MPLTSQLTGSCNAVLQFAAMIAHMVCNPYRFYRIDLLERMGHWGNCECS